MNVPTTHLVGIECDACHRITTVLVGAGEDDPMPRLRAEAKSKGWTVNTRRDLCPLCTHTSTKPGPVAARPDVHAPTEYPVTEQDDEP